MPGVLPLLRPYPQKQCCRPICCRGPGSWPTPSRGLAQQQGPGTTLGEVAVALAVFVCAFLGVADAAVWLAAGYALHGVWDWFHDIEAVPTRVSRWFPPACAAFDFVVAGFILLFLG